MLLAPNQKNQLLFDLRELSLLFCGSVWAASLSGGGWARVV